MELIKTNCLTGELELPSSESTIGRHLHATFLSKKENENNKRKNRHGKLKLKASLPQKEQGNSPLPFFVHLKYYIDG